MYIKKITCAILSLFLILIPNITFASSNIYNVIKFTDAAIEKETRRILNKENGGITEAEVLKITDFELIELYEESLTSTFNNVIITTLNDLRLFKNLKTLNLYGYNIDNLEGIEKLTKLEILVIRNAKISSIEALSNLKNLKSLNLGENKISDVAPLKGLKELNYLDLSDNYISDIIPLENLVNLETLDISNNCIINLSPLKNLIKLKKLYANHYLDPNGTADISVVSNLKNLEELVLSENNIVDVTPIKNLSKLNYLNLGLNSISDITSLEKFSHINSINLRGNPIPNDVLNKFFEPIAGDYFTKTFREKINENKPEFTFDLLAFYNKKISGYSIKTITVTDTSNGKVLQKISIPEFTINGNTELVVYFDSNAGNLGFELIDVNFDGYKDIRLYDTHHYMDRWIYFVWNPNKNIYEFNEKLTEIPNIEFDETNKLIYSSIGKYGYLNNYSTTYKYFNGVPVPVKYYSKEFIKFTNEEILKYFKKISIEAEIGDGMGFHEVISERDEKTGEMKVVSDEFVFYPKSKVSERLNYPYEIAYISDEYNVNAIARFDDSTEIYKALKNIKFYQ